MLDVVEAVDGAQPAFVCTEIRQRGPLATPAGGVHERRARSTGPWPPRDEAWRAALRGVTLADLARDVTGDYGPATFVGIRQWLKGPDDS